MKAAERVLKALASRRRLVMLAYLRGVPEATIGEIAYELHFSYKATAWNIRKLLLANLLDGDRRGPFVYYRLPHQAAIFLRTVLIFVRKLEW